jgi:hypothetical protein
VPKHRNTKTLITLHYSGVSQVGISGLASTRDLPLDIPGAETPKHHISSTLLSFRGFASQDFGTWRVQGNLPLGIPGAETLKHQDSITLHYSGVSQVRISGLASTRDLPLDIPGVETPKHHISSAIIIPGFRKSGFQDWRVQGNLPLGILGAETLKHQDSSQAIIFRGFTSQDFGTGEYKRLAFRYPGCRNTETPYLIRAIIILGFHKSGFRTGEYKGTYP